MYFNGHILSRISILKCRISQKDFCRMATSRLFFFLLNVLTKYLFSHQQKFNTQHHLTSVSQKSAYSFQNQQWLMRKREDQPLVVSSCARGGAGASRVAAQFIIYIFPLSACCDLKREVEVYYE